MKARISENKLLEIFFACDEFCQLFERRLAEYHLEYFQNSSDSFVQVKSK
jgi:hypothetical protein